MASGLHNLGLLCLSCLLLMEKGVLHYHILHTSPQPVPVPVAASAALAAVHSSQPPPAGLIAAAPIVTVEPVALAAVHSSQTWSAVLALAAAHVA